MQDRILGGLFGQALGDAWAMPAMLTPDDTWEKYGGWITGFLPGPEDHPVHGGYAGRVSLLLHRVLLGSAPGDDRLSAGAARELIGLSSSRHSSRAGIRPRRPHGVHTG